MKGFPTSSALLPSAVVSRFEAALIERIGDERFGLWFRGSAAFVPTGAELLVVVSTTSHQDWLSRTFGDAVRRASAETFGDAVAVRFVVDETLARGDAAVESKPASKPTLTLFGTELPLPEKLKAKASPAKPQRRWKSLADFVPGTVNRLATASVQSLLDEPGECGIPLVLHGPVGTGKTHLLEGLYAALRKREPESRPVFVTAEEFTTRYVQSCRFDKQAQFRRQFRDCSALFLDDLHFLATKPGSQKEFLQTLDRLAGDHRPVVLTTDCHPKLAEELLPELADRLLGGMVVGVQPPDEATRRDILRVKGGGVMPFPADVIDFLAARLKGNVRELEGAVHSIKHFARVAEKAVDLPLVKEAIGELLRHSVRSVTVQEVDDAVCAICRLANGALRNATRTWTVSHPRMIAIYLARKLTAATYGEVSKHFGLKTHSTAVAAEKKVRTWLGANEKLAVGEREWNAKDLLDRVEREIGK